MSQAVEQALVSFANSVLGSEEKQLSALGSGVGLSKLLRTVEYFRGRMGGMMSSDGPWGREGESGWWVREGESGSWVARLSNLKQILMEMVVYLKEEHKKQLETRDIDLLAVAKHSSKEHLERIFECVVAVFMHSGQKDEFIQRIMTLSEDAQHALVGTVRNALTTRVKDIGTLRPHQMGVVGANEVAALLQHKEMKVNTIRVSEMSTARANEISTARVNEMSTARVNEMSAEDGGCCWSNVAEALLHELVQAEQRQSNLEREIDEGKDHIATLEQEFQNYRLSTDADISKGRRQSEVLAIANEEIKEQLLSLMRENEQIQNEATLEGRRKQETINLLNNQVEALQNHIEQIESLEAKHQSLEQEKKKLARIIEEKDSLIFALQQRSKLWAHTNRPRTEDKGEGANRGKKEVDNRNKKIVTNGESYANIEFNLTQQEWKKEGELPSTQTIVSDDPKIMEQRSQHQEQVSYLEEELQSVRKALKETKIQNSKLKKKLKLCSDVENQKKNMESLLRFAHSHKQKQIELLLVSLFQLRNQNISLQNQLKK